MTDKEKLDKLVAEIETVKVIIQSNRAQGVFAEGYLIGQESVLEHFENFIDSMQEEPKDKCRGCNNVKGCITCVDGSEYAHIEECNITGIKSKHATGKLKECIDNVKKDKFFSSNEGEYLEEETNYCAFSTSRYTDKERKALCKGCEEDENTLNGIIEDLNSLKQSNPSDISKGVYQEEINWLKSLRPQSTWKPTEDELECLSDAIHSLNYPSPVLGSLLEQLKKLREE